MARNASQGLSHLARQTLGVQPQHPTEIGHGPVVHEPLARDAEDPDGDVAVDRVGESDLFDELEDAAPKASGHDALLERDEEPLAARLIKDQLAIERPRVPGVDDTNRPPLRGQQVGRLDCPGDDRSEPDKQQVAPFAQHLATPDRDDRRG